MSSKISECPSGTTLPFDAQHICCHTSNTKSFFKDVNSSERSSARVILFSKKFPTMRYLYLLIMMLFSCSLAYSQDVIVSNGCGQNLAIQTFVNGVSGTNRANRINVGNTPNFSKGYIEVWMTSQECSPFPNSIQLRSNTGETINAQGMSVQNPGNSTELERVYRGTFNNAFTSAEITNLNGCTDAVSIAAYIEREEQGSASFLVQFNRELHGASVGQDDCLSINLNVGSENFDRDFDIMLPIHEKDGTTEGRTVRYTITSGNQTITRTRSDLTNGPEASLYEETIRVPAGQSRIRIEVCSPRADGDSFGVGAVSVSLSLIHI